MYEIRAQVEFSAAHHLLDYEGGKCENQHGHNWLVEAFVRGDILDQSNILVDFKGESPSSEFIANYIYYRLKEKYVELHKISVWESRESCATYFEAE